MPQIIEQYGREGYSKLTGFSQFSYNAVQHLLDNNETIWKLLYYNDKDAWNKPNTSLNEKRSLIYGGEPDETLYRVFISEKQPDAWVHEACILRVFPSGIVSDNRTINTAVITFDVYSHYRIDTLSNYTTRVDVIVEELVSLFNGFNIGGLGRLYLNGIATKQTGARESGQIPYAGKRIVLATKQN